jgi:hypothetical protein
MLEATTLPETPEAEDDLCRRVLCYLADRGIDVRSLRVEAQGEHIRLYGRVPCARARELACECCHRVAGVREVDCELTVEEGGPETRKRQPFAPASVNKPR